MNEEGGFRPGTVAILVAVAALAFAGFVAMLAFAPDLRTRGDGAAHAASRSAVGYAGIVRLLGDDAVVSRQERTGDAGLLVVTPDAFDDGDDDVMPLQRDAPMLVVVEKWTYDEDPRRRDRVRETGVDDLDMYRTMLGEVAGRITMRRDPTPQTVTLRGVSAPWTGRTWSVGQVRSFTTIGGEDAFPLIVDEQGRAVLAQVGGGDDDGQKYVLSEPDLLNNLGMAGLPRAEFADAMLRGLRSGDGPIVFDVSLNGFGGGRSLLRLALTPPFLSATLCVLAAALLAGFHGAARFGPAAAPERAIAFGKRALADNAAALIRLGKREHRMAPRYARLVRDRAARAVGAPRELGPDAQTAFLDRVSARRGAGPTLTDLVARADAVLDPSALMAAADALHRWRLEMTRAR